ncbi:MAG: prephenate dehydratase [Candidatus Micrarchaeota archaeon]
MSLEMNRKKIDEVDRRIVELISERIKIARQIGEEKEKSGKGVYDPKREEELLKKIEQIAQKKGLDVQELKRIFIDIFYVSKKEQAKAAKAKRIEAYGKQKIRVGFQGTRGAYSESAMKLAFPHSIAVGFRLFSQPFDALVNEKIDVAVIPIENSTFGSVLPVYDLLMNLDVKAVGEIKLPIEHCLLGIQGSELKDITEVYSHPQALAQCRDSLARMKIKQVECFDTAGAAEMVAKKKDRKMGAIASENAAGIYGLKILKKGIQDKSGNMTRFLVFVRSNDKVDWQKDKSKQYKTSIIFSVPHVTGSLFKALKILADNKINLTKIESRPTGKVTWEYLFYIDFIGNLEDTEIKKIMDKFKEQTQYLRLIGSYPTSD